ncbi:MAG: N-acetylmuramoyl-L-alanine amidase [Nitrospirae bacterium]|nr:N-acetylmuramoyl-L-alanine amidase [Nitrospirota bacterium]MCL5423391.1 N-acetylmuramoyl-L-alanine amidase [Nitrospirota bacterium]
MIMLSAFPKKKELRIRQTILRGVYEDNLRIIGKGSAVLSNRPSFSLKKISLFISTVLLALLGYGNYSDLSLSPDKQIAPLSIAAQQLSPLPAETSVHPSEYAAFFGGQAHLKRVFGLAVKTIMIDPGHGGADSGTVGKLGTREKDITLDIAKRLKERLKKQGYSNVLLTREEDITLPLNKRVELANSGRADLFISIHLNYLPSKPINIIETYYFGPSSDAKTLKLAEQENAGSHYGLSDFKEIIEKIGETVKLQESRELAGSIQQHLFVNSLKQNGNVQDFGVKRAPFVVLLGVNVPAVLAEVSCLSNREEEVELNTESHRENIARYLEAGILHYLSKGEVRYEAKRLEEGR